MKRLFLSIFVSCLLSSCSTVRLVTDYDAVIDNGITEFSEQLNAHIKNMGELGGKPDGTYDANLKTYNALDAKIDILIARATNASEGSGCKLEEKLFKKVSAILKNNVPIELAQSTEASTSSASACNAKLLALVKVQLAFIREIHRDTDKCGNPAVSCIRLPTATDALAIANQSINAVSVVEAAKKSQ